MCALNPLLTASTVEVDTAPHTSVDDAPAGGRVCAASLAAHVASHELAAAAA